MTTTPRPMESELPPHVAICQVQMTILKEDLDGIKEQLLKLSDVITEMALLENRQERMSEATEKAFALIEQFNVRLNALQTDLVLNKANTATNKQWVDRALLFLAGAAAMFIAKFTGLL
jgi:hypothetical protein